MDERLKELREKCLQGIKDVDVKDADVWVPPAVTSQGMTAQPPSVAELLDRLVHLAIEIEGAYDRERPAQAEPALNRKQIMEILYHGRTRVNFHHVPEVTRAIDWLNQEFTDALATPPATAAPAECEQ
jgi:hypothetical protein